MTPDLILGLFKSAIILALLLVAPFLGVSLVIGLVVSLLQAVTSIQEQTLVFAPKLAAVAVTFIVTAPWIFRQMGEFITQVFSLMRLAAT